MSRYALIATLQKVEQVTDDRGNASYEVTEERKVQANRYNIGLSTWAAARSNGLHADAEVSMRSCEYKGEERITVEGVEYEVETAQCSGEFTSLTLKRRLSNGD